MDVETTNATEDITEEEQPLISDEDSIGPKKSTNWEAGYHIVCVIAGTGLLQIPFALSKAGWLGIVLLVGSGWINMYTGTLLSKCLYQEDVTLGGFPQVGFAAYGTLGSAAVQFCYNAALLGSACLYLILSGMNLADLVGICTDRQWIVVCAAFLCVPYVLNRNLKDVGLTSALGALASLAMVFIVTCLSAQDYERYRPVVKHDWLLIQNFGTVMGTFAFSFGGNYVYPQVQASMAKPQDFSRVLLWSTVVIASMYLLVGVTGYGTYGDLTLSPVSLNLAAGPWKVVCNIIITMHVLMACPILLTTFALDTEARLGLDKPQEDSQQFKARAALRIAIMAGVVLVSCTIPYFADVMTLIGAVANTMLIFVFPVLFYHKLVARTSRSLVVGGMVVCIGLVGGALGTIDALGALYKDVIGVK